MNGARYFYVSAYLALDRLHPLRKLGDLVVGLSVAVAVGFHYLTAVLLELRDSGQCRAEYEYSALLLKILHKLDSFPVTLHARQAGILKRGIVLDRKSVV